MGTHARWTEQELCTLRDLYPLKGMNGVKHLLPRHSERAIYSRANRMRLVSGAIWTVDEIKKLASLYPSSGKRCAREFPNRSWISILRQAARLGLRTA